jgi:hypothetical protein
MAGLSDNMLESLVAQLKAAQARRRELESALVGFEAKARRKLRLPEPEDLVAEILAVWEGLTTLGDKTGPFDACGKSRPVYGSKA